MSGAISALPPKTSGEIDAQEQCSKCTNTGAISAHTKEKRNYIKEREDTSSQNPQTPPPEAQKFFDLKDKIGKPLSA